MPTCDGRCCAVFPLPKDARARFAAGANGEDAPFILLMLLELTPDEAQARAARLGYELPAWSHESHDLFTCRHWDETTRLCAAYEQRPAMCSDYPYTRSCRHESCSFTVPADQLSRAYE